MSHTEFQNSAIAQEQRNEHSLRESVVMIACFLVVMAGVVAAFAAATA